MAEKMILRRGSFFGIGNPLLDVSKEVDEDFLERYKLKENEAILARDEHAPLFRTLNKQGRLAIGGSSQNVMRTILWFLQQKHIASYMGCVGDDFEKQNLMQLAESAGLDVKYQTHAKLTTGRCAVLISSRDQVRTMVASLGASEAFTADFLDEKENWASINLNNSISDRIRHICRSPIISPLTNGSNTFIPELAEMDKRIAEYFINDGFFRTINYIHCTIDDQRRNPSINIRIDIYLVTNREFRSLLYIEMPNITRNLFVNNQARFYIHNNEQNFKYNFNISNINYTSAIYMIKLYKQINQVSSNTLIIFSNMITILFNLVLFLIFF
ncbi:unnamed protein product [Rotaria sordida]|uniref:Adenosine kinase n=1 Tax=Rotaria sordida TaxID=392033 RepID=A0A815BQN5_9BILA|nr:unnamed protein product [Rotaria sordida]CAF1273342.1 unnamed protein product [Rotaria sordida]